MHFVFISTMSGVPWGGSEELWSQAALRLHQEGHKVSVSVVWWPQLSTRVLELEKRGINLFTLKPSQHNLLPARLWHKVKRRFLVKEKKEFQWLRLQKPDLVVISQGGISDGVERMNFCAEADLPFAAIVHSNTESWWPDDNRSLEMAKAYHAARKVFCVSRHNLKLLERQIGQLLPSGVVICATVTWNPHNDPDSLPPDWPDKGSTWKMACIARLEPAHKGQDVLFEVLAQPNWRQRDVELNLYGEGPSKNVLMRSVQRLGLQNVNFCQRVTHVKEVWRKNHLLVMPSRFEGLPAVLVEAMWCERPSVVTDVGGNAELCAEGQTGFIAPAPTVELFASALERAWNRRNDWQNMGKLARLRVEQFIPKDPVGDFCRQLTDCVEKQEAGTGK